MKEARSTDDGRLGTAVQLASMPRDDRAFLAWLEHLTRMAGDLRLVTPDYFELMVRGRYPTAIVRPQEPLGTLDPFTTVWYVYRDGSPSTQVDAQDNPAA
jgi:hypothetical protein